MEAELVSAEGAGAGSAGGERCPTRWCSAPSISGPILDGSLDESARAGRPLACRLDPKDAVCRFALGRVYLARGDYTRSIAELETAIRLNPSLAQAHCALGDSLTYAGKPQSAMPCFDEAVRLSPHDPYRWAFLSYGALALLFEGDYAQSVAWSSEAVQEPNCHYWAHALLAAGLGHLGRHRRSPQRRSARCARRCPGSTAPTYAAASFTFATPPRLRPTLPASAPPVWNRQDPPEQTMPRFLRAPPKELRSEIQPPATPETRPRGGAPSCRAPAGRRPPRRTGRSRPHGSRRPPRARDQAPPGGLADSKSGRLTRPEGDRARTRRRGVRRAR